MQAQKNSGRVLAIVVALLAISQVGETILMPSMPMMAAMLDTTPGQIQALVGIYLVFYGMSVFVYGPLSDHYGRRPVVLGSLVFALVGAVLAFSSWSIQVLQCSTALLGAGMGTGGLMCRTMLRDMYVGRSLHKATAKVGVASIIAPLIAPVLGASLLAWFCWQANYIFLALCILIIIIVCYFGLDETNHRPGENELRLRTIGKMYWAILCHKRFLGNTLCVSFNCASLFAYEVAAPFILQEQCGLSPTAYAWVSVIPLLGFLSGSSLSSYLGGKMLRYQITLSGLIVSLFSALTMLVIAWVQAPSIVGIILPMCLFFFGSGLLYSATSTEALMPFGRQAGIAGATLGGILNVSAGFAASLMSIFDIVTAVPLGLELTGTAVVCLALFFVWVRPYQVHSGDLNLED